VVVDQVDEPPGQALDVGPQGPGVLGERRERDPGAGQLDRRPQQPGVDHTEPVVVGHRVEDAEVERGLQRGLDQRRSARHCRAVSASASASTGRWTGAAEGIDEPGGGDPGRDGLAQAEHLIDGVALLPRRR
jgi:hypothetical protein